MTFRPIVPAGGLVGWSFLNRTFDRQSAAFATQPALQRDEVYFREKIGQVATAEDLVSDRRLLRVALGAFGLESDINSRFFIRKVLEDGALDPKALSNRLADKRYLSLSKAFGFGDFATPNTRLSDFADRILPGWKTRSFEAAVGEVNEPMRLALNAQRELSALSGERMSERAKWFTVMGTPPLRRVFETALALPGSFGVIDIERQLGILQERSQAVFGTSDIAGFADADRREALVRRFILFSDTGQPPVSGTSIRGVAALSLLQAAAR